MPIRVDEIVIAVTRKMALVNCCMVASDQKHTSPVSWGSLLSTVPILHAVHEQYNTLSPAA